MFKITSVYGDEEYSEDEHRLWFGALLFDWPYLYSGELSGGEPMASGLRKWRLKNTIQAIVLHDLGPSAWADDVLGVIKMRAAIVRTAPLGYGSSKWTTAQRGSTDIAKNSSGKLVTSGRKVAQLNPLIPSVEWTFRTNIGVPGGGDISKTYGVAVDSSDDVIVAGEHGYDEAAVTASSWNFDTNYISDNRVVAVWPAGMPYVCIKDHLSDPRRAPSINRPYYGSDWQTYWKLDYASVWKLDSSGNFIWRYDAECDCFAVDVDSSDNIYVGCNDDELDGDSFFKLDSSGVKQWGYDTNGLIRHIRCNSSDKIIAVGERSTDIDAKLASIRKFNPNGTVAWVYDTGCGLYGVDVDHNDGDSIYVAGGSSIWSETDPQLWKLDDDGNLIWTRNVGIRGASVAVHKGIVALGCHYPDNESWSL